jgi:hypothetical protein
MLQPVSFRGAQPRYISQQQQRVSRLEQHFIRDAVCVTVDLTLRFHKRRMRYLRPRRQRLQVTALWDVTPGIFMFYDLFNNAVSITDYIDSNDKPFYE